MPEIFVPNHSPSDEELEQYRTVYEGLKKPPKTSAELYQFLTALTGEVIPFEPCCDGHRTPWDFIWRCYRVDLEKYRGGQNPHLIYLGPRGGFKTLSIAKTMVAEMLLKPGCFNIGIGAIEQHALVAYGYMQRYLQNSVIRELDLVAKLTMRETTLRNGSKYKQACATLSGTQGNHPHKLRLEELDAGWKENILEEAKISVKSYNGLQAHTSYVSSRKFDGSIMDQLIEKAPSTKMDLLISCYKDTSEPCPESRRGRNKKMYEVEDIFNPGDSVVVEAYEFCGGCPLLPSCKGDLARAKGIVPIDDHIMDWNALDRETWIYQKECRKAKATDLFFSEWVEDLQVGDFPYNPEIGWVDLSIDFTGGGDDPTVVGFWQTDAKDNDFLNHEMIFSRQATAACTKKVEEFIGDMRIKMIRHQIGDSAAMQSIIDWNAQNPKLFKIKPVKKTDRRTAWSVMRQRIRDSNGDRHIFVNRPCKLWRHEIKTVKRSRTDPLDIRAGQSDHSLDQGKYRFVHLRWNPQNEARIRILEVDDDRTTFVGGLGQSKTPEDASGISRVLDDQ